MYDWCRKMKRACHAPHWVRVIPSHYASIYIVYTGIWLVYSCLNSVYGEIYMSKNNRGHVILSHLLWAFMYTVCLWGLQCTIEVVGCCPSLSSPAVEQTTKQSLMAGYWKTATLIQLIQKGLDNWASTVFLYISHYVRVVLLAFTFSTLTREQNDETDN